MDDKNVQQFVEAFLKDHDNLNIKLVPDSIEIAVYKTLLASMIKLLLKTTENVSVKFEMCGQPLELKIALVPVAKDVAPEVPHTQ